MSDNQASGFGTRTPQIVGRAQEVELLRDLLHRPHERHYVYFWADGGSGKTRLLQELQIMVAKAGAGYCTSGIIDLYHTDTHSTSDVERTIVESLDPEERYFTRYRQQRKEFEKLRERGADPAILEKRRAELSRLFVLDCRELAEDMRKIVICFDTVELLQYESSVVEELAGLDATDARIKPWLLQHLAELRNVLVVFAGRPRLSQLDEPRNAQRRFIEDLQMAFKQDFLERPLAPLTCGETSEFIATVAGDPKILAERYIPIVHRLTAGRPIIIHVLVDLLRTLGPNNSEVFQFLEDHSALVEVPDDEPQLSTARENVEILLLRGFHTQEIGGYLEKLASMPKGFDAEMLQSVFGFPLEAARELVARLEPLSFVKRYTDANTQRSLHADRLFLHDEMYRLWNNPKVIRNQRIHQRQVATQLTSYYDKQIKQLEAEINELAPDDRIRLRERLQKLQVEWLYYSLVQDPKEGYARDLQLNEAANRRRWVGFGMRLLDEFLRFYNSESGRALFRSEGIAHEEVLRHSVQLWVERFYWWGQTKRAVEFGRRILDDPASLFLDSVTDIAMLATICARWADASAVLYGYDPAVIQRAREIYSALRAAKVQGKEHLLARARLCTSIGYQFRLGGMLAQATRFYAEAKAAFVATGELNDEYAMLLNNSAFAYGKQGHMTLARTLGHEALAVHNHIENEYIRGLTYSTLSNIARMRGNYAQARSYGEDALEIFQAIEEQHGTVLAYLGIAQADRRMAKHEVEKGQKMEAARLQLSVARASATTALENAEKYKLESDIPLVEAELGRIARDLGHAVHITSGLRESLPYFREAQDHLQAALRNTLDRSADRADLLQDLAEVFFDMGDRGAVQEWLAEIRKVAGDEHMILPASERAPNKVSTEYFLPLGKMEMLQGQIDFTDEHSWEGLQHFVLAYLYFSRFSSEALEIDTMVEYLYRHLGSLPVEEQQDLLRHLDQWLEANGWVQECRSFVENLRSLLGFDLSADEPNDLGLPTL